MKINPSKAYNQINKTYNGDSAKESGKSALPKQGEVVKGEIIDLQQSSVKIKLNNGQVIEAKLTEAFEFFIGQKLEFFVKESSLDQILLKPILEQTNLSENKLIQILENAGITVNKDNLNVVIKLLENNMPVDKDTLLKVIPFTKQFNTSIDQILFLVKNNIPVTKDNIEQLTNLLNNNNKIIQNLASISDDLASLLKDGVGYEMAKILLQDHPEARNLLEQLKQQVQSQTDQLNQNQLNQNQNLEGAQTQKLINGQNISAGTLLDSLEVKSQATDQIVKLDLPINEILSNQQAQNLETQISHLIKEELGDVKFSFNHQSLDELFHELNTLQLSPELKEKVLDLITNKVTYALFNKALFANDKQLESPEELKAFYERLHDKVTKLLDLSGQSTTEKAASLTKEAHQVKSAIEFMGDLNQRFNYIQLPMLLGDQLLHSELYVLNDKRKIKGDKGTLTALIRLDMLNLGHLDIYVTKADKNVTIQFYTEDENKSALIDNKLFMIHNQLNKLGFKVLGISVTKKEKDFNVTDDFLKREEVKSHEVKRYTFDMRA